MIDVALGSDLGSRFSASEMARATGLEPATSGVTGRHSNQLSYARAACSLHHAASASIPLRGMARTTGLEPATSGVTGRHSNRLSYVRPASRSAAMAAVYGEPPTLSSRRLKKAGRVPWVPRGVSPAHRTQPVPHPRPASPAPVGRAPSPAAKELVRATARMQRLACRVLHSRPEPLNDAGTRAVSSVGRASRLHREGRRFEPVTAHQCPRWLRPSVPPSAGPSRHPFRQRPPAATGPTVSPGHSRVTFFSDRIRTEGRTPRRADAAQRRRRFSGVRPTIRRGPEGMRCPDCSPPL